MLLPGGHSRLRMAMARKADLWNQLPSRRSGGFDPVPANAEIAVAAKPMGVHPPPAPRGHHLQPLSGDIESGHRQDKPQPGESTDGAHLRFLDVPAVGLVIEKFSSVRQRQCHHKCTGFKIPSYWARGTASFGAGSRKNRGRHPISRRRTVMSDRAKSPRLLA